MRALVIVVAMASAAGADPVATERVRASELPKGVTMRGDTFVSAQKFTDKNGANYVVFSSKQVTKQAQGAPSITSWIYVEDIVVPAQGAPRNLLPVRDVVEDCVMGDPRARFHDDAFTVTDLNHDGIAEVTFGYELSNCRSDVRPAAYKLLILDNGTKYILRGTTRINDGASGSGGTFEPDPAPAKWPAALLTHAKDVWAKTSADLDMPPRR